MSTSVMLVRMVLPDHTCPYGVRCKAMLEESAIPFEERILSSREETDAFEAEQGVSTTPQVFVDGERIGGSKELERWIASRTAVAPGADES